MTNRLAIGFAVLFCSTACSAIWAADYQHLDVKAGQWETTLNGQTSGMPPIPDEVLNRLTPEQRARMQAAMQARGAKATVSKGCLTKDQLDKPFDLGDQNTKACTRTLVTSSGSRQEIRLDCNRQGTKSTGTIKLEAVNSENVKGSMLMTMTNAEHTMNMNYTFAAKWIGPACIEK
ncbi:MAG: DUF3617 domain-containing protein [Bryobacteraceae bacterium]